MSLVQSRIRKRKSFLISPHISKSYSSSLSSSSSAPSLPSIGDFHKESTPPSSSSSGSRISPAILFIIVVLAVVFFISGLLHLLMRLLVKQRTSSSVSESDRFPEMAESSAFQRQLQQLFQLHDSGLDQAFIDALPVFLYEEIMGLKEPFDCSVCLCEFSGEDRLRLLPMCSHAFHIDCIDTWLLSNSNCPLCRGNLYTPGLPIENPIFEFEDSREGDSFPGTAVSGVPSGHKPAENEVISDKRVFSVRLGKFRGLNNGGRGGEGVERGEGETSSSNLAARRCYSMGSYQYVVADSTLQVALSADRGADSGRTISDRVRLAKGRVSHMGKSSVEEESDGKKINIASKNESFSVSKIWLWSRNSKYPRTSNTHMDSPFAMGFPVTERSQGTSSSLFTS